MRVAWGSMRVGQVFGPLLALLFFSPLVGCGGVHYAVTVTTASSRVAEARELGADQWAPYEYYYAKAHLEQAQVEANEASYSDAANFAETAEEYAVKAIDATRAARRTDTGPSAGTNVPPGPPGRP